MQEDIELAIAALTGFTVAFGTVIAVIAKGWMLLLKVHKLNWTQTWKLSVLGSFIMIVWSAAKKGPDFDGSFI